MSIRIKENVGIGQKRRMYEEEGNREEEKIDSP